MKILKYFILFFIAITLLVDVYFIHDFHQGGLPIIRSDGEGYYAYLPAVVIYKTVDFRVLEQSHFTGGIPETIFLKTSTGIPLNKYPIGVAVLMSPFFLIAHFITSLTNLFPVNGYSIIYQGSILISALFYYLLGIYLLFKFLKKYFSEKIVILTIIFITFGTSLFHYVTYDACFSHVYSFACVALLLYLTDKFWRSSNLQIPILIGILIGILFLIRNYNLIYSFYLFFYPLNRLNLSPKINSKIVQKLVVVFISSLLTVCPQLLIWKIATGHFITYSYGKESFKWLSPQIGNVLFSINKGLFVWAPTLIIAILGLVFGIKQIYNKQLKTIARLSTVIIVLLTYIISSWWAWDFGGSYGHRGFIDAYPFFAIGLAIFLQYCCGNWKKNFIYAALIISTVIVNIQMFNYWNGIIPFSGTTPSMYIQALKEFPKRLQVNLFIPESRKSTSVKSGLKALLNPVNDTKIPNIVKAGQATSISYSVVNKGKSFWIDRLPLNAPGKGKVSLGVLWFPQDLMGSTCRRSLTPALEEARVPLPKLVAPGEKVYLYGSIQTPKNPGEYIMLLEMVSDGVAWFGDVGNSTPNCYKISVE